MNKIRRLPPAPEELSTLYLALAANVEKLEGMVRQLMAERTHSDITTPTWKDYQEIKADIDRLRAAINNTEK
jgi:hypothetical protein